MLANAVRVSAFSSLDVIKNVIRALPFSAHLRALDSKQYLLSNIHHAKRLNFQKTQEATHFTYNDLVRHRRKCIEALGGNLVLEDEYQQFISNANIQVARSKTPRRFQVCTLFPTGFIYASFLQKIPIANSQDDTYAILTLAQDITTHFDLIDLYLLYKKHYGEGRRAIQQFIRYLNIEDYFRILPTQQELLTVLMFRKDIRAKYAARELQLSERTVEEYKARLRNKLSIHFNLEALLLRLRNPFRALTRDDCFK